MKTVPDGVGDAVLRCRPVDDNAGVAMDGLEVEGSVGLEHACEGIDAGDLADEHRHRVAISTAT
jgi:hypothetical protein